MTCSKPQLFVLLSHLPSSFLGSPRPPGQSTKNTEEVREKHNTPVSLFPFLSILKAEYLEMNKGKQRGENVKEIERRSVKKRDKKARDRNHSKG